jgi:Peptidase family M48
MAGADASETESAMKLVSAGLLLLFVILPVPNLVAESRTNPEKYVDKIVERESAFVETMRGYSPVVETYLQKMQPDPVLGFLPAEDKYFLGRVRFSQSEAEFYLSDKRLVERLAGSFSKFYSLSPVGFSSMIFVDRTGLNRDNYEFRYMQGEFLGEVRCWIFDVTPRKGRSDRFRGRIWVEDEGFNIVRFNGSYGAFHIDSWRKNLRPGLWLPSLVYSEEFESLGAKASRQPRVKAQTRMWGYNLSPAGKEQEFSQIEVDSRSGARDTTETSDMSPLESQRAWQRRAEDNVLQRLEQAGLLAPEGEVDDVLHTVVTNLELTNNLTIEPAVRCRVLLTTPLEMATIGHTILISRGLLDVLPNEASLALVLAHSLAHVAAGHDLDSGFGFNDRLMSATPAAFPRVELLYTAEQEQQANDLGVRLLTNSPYKEKAGDSALFLKFLADFSRRVPNLAKAIVGESLVDGSRVLVMSALLESAPRLQQANPDQIAALPVGSRIKLDSWAGRLEMVKSTPPRIYSPKDKLSLQITPLLPHLSRFRPDKPGVRAVGPPSDRRSPEVER